MAEKRDLTQVAVWREIVAKQGRGRKGVRAFCRQEGIAEWQFYAWREKLRRRRRNESAGPVGTFVPVKLKGLEGASAAPFEVEIEFEQGVMVRLRAGVDEDTLDRVMRCLGVPRC